MDAIIFTIIIVGLVVAALSLRRRHQFQPRSQLAGSTNFVDRDVQRLREDLRTL